jgi:hypothetical protein
MLETEDSILNQYQLEFKLFNIEIEFTKEVLQDEKFFDKLFSRWYENQKEKNSSRN